MCWMAPQEEARAAQGVGVLCPAAAEMLVCECAHVQGCLRMRTSMHVYLRIRYMGAYV
jgi:hypothetical protein